MEIKYLDEDTGFIALKATVVDGVTTLHITQACMRIETGDEVREIVDDFKRRLADGEAKPQPKTVSKQERVAKPKVLPPP